MKNSSKRHFLTIAQNRLILQSFLGRSDDFDLPELGMQGFGQIFELLVLQEIQNQNSRGNAQDSGEKPLQEYPPESLRAENRSQGV